MYYIIVCSQISMSRIRSIFIMTVSIQLDLFGMSFYPVHGANFVPIQPTCSAYPYHVIFFLVIALTTFMCIVRASVTKGTTVCFVVTTLMASQKPLWRHSGLFALRNILTVYISNGATCAKLKDISKQCEVTTKARRQSAHMLHGSLIDAG